MPSINFNNDDLGFGSTSSNVATSTEEITDLGTGKVVTTASNGDNVSDIVNATSPSSTGGEDPNKTIIANNTTNNDQNKTTTTNTNNVDETKLESGTVIELDDNSYTVDTVGNLVDKDGNIFKKAEEVSEFLKGLQEAEDTENSVNIDSIIKTVGIDIIGEDNKPITFDNTPEGITSYINSVIELKQTEFAEAGVNKLFQTYPIVNDFINYYIANGNSIEGFGEIKDRSNISIDETNIGQQEAIIREAHKEFNKRGNIDNYIKYLKDTGSLLDVAKEELTALQQSDSEIRKANADEAARLAKEEEKEFVDYWNKVNETIKNRVIGGYKIPETIIIEKDGKKVSATPNDFYNYLYQVDDKGNSRYATDMNKETPEQRQNDELLRAYLKFIGKGYDSLVDMAIAQKEVTKLRYTSSQRANKTVKITSPSTTSSNSAGDISTKLGFNI